MVNRRLHEARNAFIGAIRSTKSNPANGHIASPRNLGKGILAHLNSNNGNAVLITDNHRFILGPIKMLKGNPDLTRSGLYGLFELSKEFLKIKHEGRLHWSFDPSTTYPLQNYRKTVEIKNEVLLPSNVFTKNVANEFKKNYPELIIGEVDNYTSFKTFNLSSQDADNLFFDIEFYKNNPWINIENICNRLDNYRPKNPTEVGLLEYAKELVNYKGLNPSGLFLEGGTGIGKTHISIGIAKELSRQGKKVLFLDLTRARFIPEEQIKNSDAIILDDFNSGFGNGDAYLKVLDHIKNTCGTLVVSTNSTYEKVVFDEALGINRKRERNYYENAGEEIFKFLQIDGVSHREANSWFTDETLSSNFNPVILDLDRAEYARIGVDGKLFSEPVIREIEKNYPDVITQRNGDTVVINTTRLTDKDLSDLIVDIQFYMANPTIAVENICCHIDNFTPKNPSQEEMLKSSLQLLNYKGTNAAGLYLQGEAGTGKTHLSIAMAKEFAKRGQKVLFIPPDGSYGVGKNLPGFDVVILDDYNSGYGKGDTFRAVVDHACQTGGRLFITSNSPYKKAVVEESFVAEEEVKARYLDRTKGLFKFHTIQGESQRAATSWFNTPFLSTDLNIKNISIDRDDYKTIKLERKVFSDQVIKEMVKNYQKITVEFKGNDALINTEQLNDKELSDLVVDLAFFKQNPTLPIENICCRLDNYIPRNNTQLGMLSSAAMLLNYEGANPAGLYLVGQAGVGKTHVSIGLAKEFMKSGKKVAFLSSDATYLQKSKIDGSDVVILDDFNSGYGKGDLLRKAISHIHKNGGRMFVSSNSPFEETVYGQSFVTDKAEIPRFRDRIQGMFMQHTLDGSSHRVENAWYKDESLDSTFVSSPIKIDKASIKEISLERDYKTESLITKLKENYPDLEVNQTDETITINPFSLNEIDLANFLVDYEFYQAHPKTPLDLLCARLDNFNPENENEEKLLQSACKLLNYNGPDSAGLFIEDPSSTRSAHIALGLAKEYFRRGINSQVIDLNSNKYMQNLKDSEITCILNYNCGYGVGDNFLKVLTRSFDGGKRLIVTNAKGFEKTVIGESFVTKNGELPRYKDRMNTLFEFHRLS